MADTLNDVEKRFVAQYMIDRDPFAAAQRTGVAKVALKKTVGKWMANPAILKAIQESTDASNPEDMITPQRIVAGFIDVAFDKSAPHASRNTALRELATLKKMYEDPEKDSKSSGVLMVPVAMSMDQWQELAAQSQAKLKETVRD